MSLDADSVVDRRRLRRKVTFWRLITFVTVVGALAFAALRLSGDGKFLEAEHIARVTIDGFISDDRKQQDLLERIAEDDDVKALILSINSPGGTTTGSEALFESIRQVAEKKPVVAVMGTIATSGGYIAAIGADHIVARGNTITGSIGVLVQWAQVQQMLANLGIQFDEVKSSPLKAEPDPFTETPPEARAVLEAMVADSYNWFVELVAERRELTGIQARRLGDGRVYSGRQALSSGLIDAVGGESVAISWLNETHGIDANMEIKDWKPGSEFDFGLWSAVSGLATKLLGGEAGNLVAQMVQSARHGTSQLDGLLSVWHPSQRESD